MHFLMKLRDYYLTLVRSGDSGTMGAIDYHKSFSILGCQFVRDRV